MCERQRLGRRRRRRRLWDFAKFNRKPISSISQFISVPKSKKGKGSAGARKQTPYRNHRWGERERRGVAVIANHFVDKAKRVLPFVTCWFFEVFRPVIYSNAEKDHVMEQWVGMAEIDLFPFICRTSDGFTFQFSIIWYLFPHAARQPPPPTHCLFQFAANDIEFEWMVNFALIRRRLHQVPSIVLLSFFVYLLLILLLCYCLYGQNRW